MGRSNSRLPHLYPRCALLAIRSRALFSLREGSLPYHYSREALQMHYSSDDKERLQSYPEGAEECEESFHDNFKERGD